MTAARMCELAEVGRAGLYRFDPANSMARESFRFLQENTFAKLATSWTAAAQPMRSVSISAYTVDGRLVMETRGVELRQGFNFAGCTERAIGENHIIVSVKSANVALRTMVRFAK